MDPIKIQRALKLASAAGDAQGAAELRQMLTQAYQSEVPKATEGMGGGQRFLAGVGQGMTNIARQAGNLVGMNSDEDLAEAARRDQALLQTGAGKAGSFLGEIAATAPVGGLAGAGAKALGGQALRGLARTATIGAAQGGAEGFLSAGPGNRGLGAAAGAAGGAFLPAAVMGAGRTLARGVEPTAAARQLLRQGVDLTPGQMNPRSALGQVEGAAKSVPVVAGLVEDAQDAARAQWRGVARQKALAPGATDASNLDTVYAGYGPAYDVAKGFPVGPRIMRTAGGDIPLADFPQTKGAFTRAARDKGTWAGEDVRATAEKWLRAQLTKLPDKGRGAGTFDSEKLTRLRSDIRDQIRKLGQSPATKPGEREILEAAEKRLTEALESQLPKSATDALRRADRQYRRFKQVESAAESAARRGSAEFTPTELARAANKADDADLWRLGNQGKLVFDQGPPPTGARAVTLGVPGLAAAAMGFPVLGPAANLAAISALAGTRTGRKLAGGNTAVQRAARAKAIALRRALGPQGRDLATLYGTTTGANTLADFYGE
jgi:hypothetical protein